MHLTGTHINYYFICKRKLWLFASGILMEQNSDLVYEGKLIHETTYPQRNEKYEEVQIGGIKVDFYDPKNKIIHEIKKSNKVKTAHEWQLKYYIFTFEKIGVDGVHGILEYPKLRKKEKIYLSDIDRMRIMDIENDILKIIHNKETPPTIKSKICKKCSYYDFCYINENEGIGK